MKNRFGNAAIILLATCLAAPVFAQSPGASAYNKYKCGNCHGADGLAATGMGKAMKVLSFKDPAMIKATDAQFIASTTKGKGKMPAYSTKMTAAEIKDVVSYIRTLQK